MILGNKTNKVYFSDILTFNPKYSKAWNRIKKILEKHSVDYELLSNTNDIWARDYMPIQIEKDKYIQFRYEPSYLKDDLHIQTNPIEVFPKGLGEIIYSNINLDGGNVVSSSNKVILTERVFKENTLETEFIKEQLAKLFNANIYYVRDLKPCEDMTGHIDGHLRFIDEETVLVNELKNECKAWQNSFLAMIESSELSYVEMPSFIHQSTKHPHSAIGCYVNYLEVEKIILYPIFEEAGNKDQEALKVIESVFPSRIIEPVNVNEIALEGGLLNCVSWSIQNNHHS